MDSSSSTDFKVHSGGETNMPTADSSPPSPSLTDAVTASEGFEDVLEEQVSHVVRHGPDNIASSYPNLGSTLSGFLEKIAPWKGIMPEHLVEDMETLGDIAAELRQAEQPVKSGLIQFSHEVLRLTMEDWHTDAPFIARDPVPVIQTYSNTDKLGCAPPRRLGDIPKRNLHEDGNRLQRVQINSSQLINDLSTITGITMQTPPVFMAPPFKLLLEYIPEINNQWALLKDQLQNMQARPENSDIENTADTPSELKTVQDSGNERTTKTSNHSNEYQEEKRNQKSELATLSERVSQLRCLLDFIQTEPDLQRILSLRAQIQAGCLETIHFPDVWLLFRPGDLVLSRVSGHLQLHKVYSATGGQVQRKAREKYSDYGYSESHDPGKSAWTGATTTVEEDKNERSLRENSFGIGSWTPLKVDCYTIDVIGDELRPVDGMWKIKHFLGEMRISDLPIYPVRYDPDTDGLLKRMEERGRMFLKSPGHKRYTGPSARLRQTGPIREIDGDVYVESNTEDDGENDLVASRVEVTESREKVNNEIRQLLGNEVDTKRSEEFMSANRIKLNSITIEEAKGSSDYLRLLPWVVHAYVFRLRRWENLDIDLIQEIERRPEARDLSFNELVIPDKTRTLLVSLVEDHASKAKARGDPIKMTDAESSPRPHVDLVRGKGEGLIILLHGPPGSGKTSTAETIAAYTQRPLYSITCGDLGLNATDVEENLSEHTRRAEKWGCVLLLDEADVFLMQRNWQDMERNALVSVFLRELEYYSGILFLTTNRPGVIDEAFLSRIHMAFRYPAIDLKSTKKMWKNIMNRIEVDNRSPSTKVTITFERRSLLKFAKEDFVLREQMGKPWNGRQIRNAFNTAIGLGRYQRLQMLSKKGISPKEAADSGDKQLMEIELTKTNFEAIAAAASSFEDYIHDLRGVDSEVALLTRVRNDHWGAEGPVAVKDYSHVRKTAMPVSGSPSRSSVTKVGWGMRRSDQSRVRPNHNTLNARSEGVISEREHSDGSEDSSSDDD